MRERVKYKREAGEGRREGEREERRERERELGKKWGRTLAWVCSCRALSLRTPTQVLTHPYQALFKALI